MSIFYVFQGETYEQERAGQNVWSPQLERRGHKNAGYTMMTNIKKGDYILHNSNGKIMAISKAKVDCYIAKQPKELSQAETSVIWNDEGYRVDTEYIDFDVPIIVTNYKEWLKEHAIPCSAFTVKGVGKLQYMCSLADEHAIFLLERAISLQRDKELLLCLKNILSNMTGNKK